MPLRKEPCSCLLLHPGNFHFFSGSRLHIPVWVRSSGVRWTGSARLPRRARGRQRYSPKSREVLVLLQLRMGLSPGHATSQVAAWTTATLGNHRHPHHHHHRGGEWQVVGSAGAAVPPPNSDLTVCLIISFLLCLYLCMLTPVLAC